MRASNKSSIITGAALLLLAALFTISLILLPLDYGVSGPGHNNVIYLLGDMLYSVYGFCSILIPGFLLTAGLSCFASKWTARKTLRLLTALIPFFTCVLTESIIRSIIKVDHSAFRIVKILIALVTGAMLVVIEYLGTGIIADRVNKGGFKKFNFPKKGSNDADVVEISEIDEDDAKSDTNDNSAESESNDLDVEFTKISKLQTPKESIFDKLKNKFKKEEDEADSDSDTSEINEVPKLSIFDKVLSDISPAAESDLSSDESDENEDNADGAETKSEEDAEIYEMSKMPIPSAAVKAETKTASTVTAQEDTEESSSPNSIITQEEYAALTTPQDELEWPDLPPQPENLPPEYDADFDENDPALEFPPKEDPVVEETAVDDVEVEVAENEKEIPATEAKEAESNKDDPYASTRYIDTVVENPKFSHKIVIRDNSEEDSDSDSAEKKTPEQIIEKPKFPTRIQLNEQKEEEVVFESKPEETDDDEDYIEDETLPFPDFDIKEPAIRTKPAIQTKSESTVSSYFEEENSTPKVSPKENLYNYFENIDT